MYTLVKRSWPTQPTHVAVLALTAALTIVLLVQTLQTGFRSQGHDFTSYLLSAEALQSGEDPYHTGTPSDTSTRCFSPGC